MADTNILSDAQLEELEAGIARRDDSMAMESVCGEYNCSCHDRLPALCQTVRALRQRVTELENERETDLIGRLGKQAADYLEQNTALREQLAQTRTEAEWQKSTIEQLTVGVTGCAEQLAQVTQERDRWRRKYERIDIND